MTLHLGLFCYLHWNGPKLSKCLQKSLAKVARPILVSNPDIVAPRGRYLSLEPGYYGHKLGSELKIQAKFLENLYKHL